jgi:hypothetical protein
LCQNFPVNGPLWKPSVPEAIDFAGFFYRRRRWHCSSLSEGVGNLTIK